MSRYLLKNTEVYRVATEEEAKKLIEEAKKDKSYTLIKYLSEYRNQKQKGEIIDEWYRVSLVKNFNEEKEPYDQIEITYTSNGDFPRVMEDYDNADED